MKRLFVKLFFIPLVLGMIISLQVFAVEKESDTYTLDPINVTAMRYEKKDLETAADVQVFSAEELKNTGSTDVANALKYKSGVMFINMGPHDQNWITGNSSINLRGISSGTLVLINGIPASFNQISHLDNIPLDAIEKIEVVKGGGSVLYGSEAYGGVINIITKDNFNNKLTAGFGDKDQARYNLALNIGNASIFIGEDKRGETENLSQQLGTISINSVSVPYFVSFGKSKKDNIGINYKINDNWNALYLYNKKDYSINYNDIEENQLKHFMYQDEEQFGQVAYHKAGFNGNAYYNNRKIKNPDYYTVNPSVREWERSNHRNYGLNANNIWKFNKFSTLLGLTAKQEEYYDENQKWATANNSSSTLRNATRFGTYSMDEYALFGQFEYNFNAYISSALSAREDVIRSDAGDYDKFLPQFQINAMLNDSSSLYATVGKSFKMPNFRNLYYSSAMMAANPDLDPEQGWNYELGYKYIQDDIEFKTALFAARIKDMISSRTVDGVSQAYNAAEYTNEGIDMDFSQRLFKNLYYNIGGIYNNPEKKNTPASPWVDTLAKYQIAGGVNYKDDKTTVALNMSYSGDRAPTSKNADVKPMLISNLHLGYKLIDGLDYQFLKGMEIKVDINNLFNRKDEINTDCNYYTEGRTFIISMDYSF
jgi:vitamin B12 transporter